MGRVIIEGQRYKYLPTLPSSHEEILIDYNDEIDSVPSISEEEMRILKEIEDLKNDKTSLQEQLIMQEQKLNDIEALHSVQINDLKTKHLEELEQKVRTLKEEYRRKFNEYSTASESNLSQKLIETQKQLKASRQTSAALQNENKILTEKIKKLEQELAEAKAPSKQIIFVDEKLYICGGIIKCEKYNHHHEDVTGLLDTHEGTTIEMTVRHCKDCNLYYIHKTVYESYREKYGALLGNFISVPNGMDLGKDSFIGAGKLAPESILHINGYNVNQKVDLPPEYRRKILTYLIESRILTKSDIREHLEFLINQNKNVPAKSEAVSRWNSDLRWVNDFHHGQQYAVWLNGTALYKNLKKKGT